MTGPADQSVGRTDDAATGTAAGEPAATGTPVVDRAAAFSATPPAIPRRFVYWFLAGIAVLGLGGVVVEHVFSSAGLNPVATAARPASPTASTVAPTPAPLPSGANGSLGASLSSFMGMTTLSGRLAPEFGVIDQSGQPQPLVGHGGQVTVLTFFNGTCNDICPVEAAEILQADRDLGPMATHVEFVTVNTNPSALAVSGLSVAQAQSGLGTLPNWHIVTAPLATMNALWKSYGITINVAQGTGVEAHNEAMFFIDPQGRERYRCTPVANETRTGTYALPPLLITRWGSGIAAYAGRLVGA